jgi:hypothetical protein
MTFGGYMQGYRLPRQILVCIKVPLQGIVYCTKSLGWGGLNGHTSVSQDHGLLTRPLTKRLHKHPRTRQTDQFQHYQIPQFLEIRISENLPDSNLIA